MAAVCEVVCYTEVRPGLSGKKMRWHFSEQRREVKELRQRLGIDDIILILQQNRLQWYGHVLREEDTDWVKKCTEYEVEGSRPRGHGKKLCKKIAKHVIDTRRMLWIVVDGRS